jgi:TPR repeat protein
MKTYQILPVILTIFSILGLMPSPLHAQNDASEAKKLQSTCIKGKFPKEQIDMNLIKEGLSLYSNECDQKKSNACYKLGLFYFQADPGILPNVKDSKKLGRTYLQKSCDLNYSRACFVLGKFLRKEFSVDEKIHRSFIEKSCRLKNPFGCSALADYYYSNRLNDPRYQQYITQSCELGLGRNCYELSRLLKEKKSNTDEIKKALESGCSLNHTRSCPKLDQEQSKDT